MRIHFVRACAVVIAICGLPASGDSSESKSSEGTFYAGVSKNTCSQDDTTKVEILSKWVDELKRDLEAKQSEFTRLNRSATIKSAALLSAIADLKKEIAIYEKLAPTPMPKPEPEQKFVLRVSPQGQGEQCTASYPCSITSAQNKTRDLRRASKGNIVTVELANGIYELPETLRFRPEDSGSDGKPVVWKAVEGENPVLSGGTKVNNWSLHDAAKGIWVADIPRGSKSRQVYINGKSAPIAQATPGELGFVLERSRPDWWFATMTGYWITKDTAAQRWFGALSDQQVANVEFKFQFGNGDWTDSRCRVESYQNMQIKMQQPCWTNSAKRNEPPRNVRTGDLSPMTADTMPSRIENAYALLSRGEWFLDEQQSKLFYIPKSGEVMSELDVRLPRLEALVTIAGSLSNPVHDIEFRGLQFSHATWNGPSLSTGFAEVQSNLHITSVDQGLCEFYLNWEGQAPGSCPFGAFSQPLSNVTVSAATRISFIENRFKNLGGVGLKVSYGSQDTKIVGNVFSDISSSAIYLGCTYDPNPELKRYGSTIKTNCTPNPDELVYDIVGENEILRRTQVNNNLIHDIGIDYWAAPGITLLFSQETNISHNQIYNTGYTGITAGIVQGHVNNAYRPNNTSNINRANIISYNLILNHMQKLHDGGAIYVEGKQAQLVLDNVGNVDRLATLKNGILVEGNVTHTSAHNFAYYNDAGSEWINWRGNVSYNALLEESSGNGGCQVTGHFWVSGNYLSKSYGSYQCGVDATDVNFDRATNATIPNKPKYSDMAQGMRDIMARAGLTREYYHIAAKEPARAVYVPSFSDGETVILSGYGFKRGTRVDVGENQVATTFISPGFITFTAPQGSGNAKVRVDGSIAPFAPSGHSATATATASSTWPYASGYGPENAIDTDEQSRWSSADQSGTITQTFTGPSIIDEIYLKEWRAPDQYGRLDYRVNSYSIEANIEEDRWKTIASGTSIGPHAVIRLPAPITARALRLTASTHNGKPVNIESFYALQHGQD